LPESPGITTSGTEVDAAVVPTGHGDRLVGAGRGQDGVAVADERPVGQLAHGLLVLDEETVSPLAASERCGRSGRGGAGASVVTGKVHLDRRAQARNRS
jgi:hypothetical protein